MPSVLTHYLLAQRMLLYLKEAHKDFSVCKNALLWGAQGPDFLYASPLESMRDLAGLLHTAPPVKTLDFLCGFAAGSKNNTDKSYALGFLTHYALDSLAHPFVLSGAAQMAKDSENLSEDTAHTIIEVTLDVIMVRYEKSDLVSSIKLLACAPKDDTTVQHMALLYPILTQSVFQRPCTVEAIAQSAKSYQKWLKRHTDRTGFKKDFLLRKEKKRRLPPGASVLYRSMTEDDTYDYANIGNDDWEDNGVIKTDTFFDLFEQADALSKAMADLFLSGGDPCTLTNGKHFL